MESTKEAVGHGLPLNQATKANIMKRHGDMYKSLPDADRRQYEAIARSKQLDALATLADEKAWLKTMEEIQELRGQDEAAAEDAAGEALCLRQSQLEMEDPQAMAKLWNDEPQLARARALERRKEDQEAPSWPLKNEQESHWGDGVAHPRTSGGHLSWLAQGCL